MSLIRQTATCGQSWPALGSPLTALSLAGIGRRLTEAGDAFLAARGDFSIGRELDTGT